jgi:hypothetical protein
MRDVSRPFGPGTYAALRAILPSFSRTIVAAAVFEIGM